MWFKQFANDFDVITPAPEREPVIGPELMEQLRILRIGAVDHRLDLTDGFEAYAGKGREAMVGIMPKARFCSAMGAPPPTTSHCQPPPLSPPLSPSCLPRHTQASSSRGFASPTSF